MNTLAIDWKPNPAEEMSLRTQGKSLEHRDLSGPGAKQLVVDPWRKVKDTAVSVKTWNQDLGQDHGTEHC